MDKKNKTSMIKKNKRREELLKKLYERIDVERIKQSKAQAEKIIKLNLEIKRKEQVIKILKEAIKFLIRVRYLKSQGIIINKLYILCRLKQYDNLIGQIKNDEIPAEIVN